MLFQTCQTIGEKTLPPQRNHFTAGIQGRRDLVVGHALGGVKDHLGPLNLEIRQRILCGSSLQFRSFRWRQGNLERA
jgi:hypothetical protein